MIQNLAHNIFQERVLHSQAGFDLVRVESALQMEHRHGDEGSEDGPVVHLLQVKALLEAQLSGRVLTLGRHQLCVGKATCPAEGHCLVQEGCSNASVTASK